MAQIKLLHGDCLELMKSIPDGSIDAIITDPPYGTTACKWDSVIPFEPMWEQLKRIIKPNGAIVMTAMLPHRLKWYHAIPLTSRCAIRWVGDNSVNRAVWNRLHQL